MPGKVTTVQPARSRSGPKESWPAETGIAPQIRPMTAERNSRLPLRVFVVASGTVLHCCKGSDPYQAELHAALMLKGHCTPAGRRFHDPLALAQSIQN